MALSAPFFHPRVPQAAQPALLYIVPGVLGATFAHARASNLLYGPFLPVNMSACRPGNVLVCTSLLELWFFFSSLSSATCLPCPFKPTVLRGEASKLFHWHEQEHHDAQQAAAAEDKEEEDKKKH